MAKLYSYYSLLPVILDSMGPQDFIEPEAELNPQDTQVGTVSDDIKKLWTLQYQITSDIIRYKADTYSARSQEEKDSLL